MTGVSGTGTSGGGLPRWIPISTLTCAWARAVEPMTAATANTASIIIFRSMWRSMCRFLPWLRAGFLPERLEQIGERAPLDQPAELRLVVVDEAHSVDGNVVDCPAVLGTVEAVRDVYLRALRGHQLGADAGLNAVHPLTEVADGLARIGLDLVQVGNGDQVREESDELFLVRGGEHVEAFTQRSPRHLTEVEETFRGLADVRSPIVGRYHLGRGRAVLRNDPLNRRLHRFRGAGRPRESPRGQQGEGRG